MDPRRHSQFYDKSTGLPVFKAEEKLQSGPLILAPRKDLEITDWNDPRLNLTDFPGKKYNGGGKVNAAIELAKKIAPKFNLDAIKKMPVSSAQKQTPVARAFEMLSSENVDPKVKQQIFKQYLQSHPDLVKKSGATSYDELTQAAYQQMAKETAGQFQALQGSGVKLSFDPTGEKAYKSSKEMLEDALQNKQLTVFQGGEPHPALNKEANEQFRAVHDYFGHGTTGASFGPKGEELAYGAHSQMYSPLARLAAATETRGQNSLVSYSGMNEELINAMNQLKAQREQLMKSGGDPSAINDQLVKLGQQFKYAPQKPLILPPEQIDINYQGFNVGGAIKKGLEHAKSLPFVHFSESPSIAQLDPRMYGKGIKGAEAARLKEALDIKPRSYFYVDKPGVKPEQGLGPHKYQGTAQDIYPLQEDPLGLSAIAKQKSLDPYLMSQGISQVDEKQHLNELERLIKQAGYKGYANDDVGLLFYPTPVKKAVEGKANGGRAEFNPEGSDYDYQTALAYGMGPTGTGEDLGHWGSVAPTSDDERMLRDLPRDAYVMLKGKAHETFDKAEAAEKERGSKVVKIGDRYYSIPK
jgi:organic radical activating enzyme